MVRHVTVDIFPPFITFPMIALARKIPCDLFPLTRFFEIVIFLLQSLCPLFSTCILRFFVMDDLSQFFCHNKQCPEYGVRGAGNTGILAYATRARVHLCWETKPHFHLIFSNKTTLYDVRTCKTLVLLAEWFLSLLKVSLDFFCGFCIMIGASARW